MTTDSIPYLTELLRSNDPPPELATDAATAILLKSMEDLRQIEAEIELLKEKRNHIQKSIDTCNTILSPVRRLPLDILREIFYHCLPTDRNPIMSAAEAPMLLTRVCGLWRSIAFSSPRIWAKLHIPFPGDPTFSNSFGCIKDERIAIRRQVFAKVTELRCQVVKEWLHRSGTCPLSISLHYPIGYTQTVNSANNSREAADLAADPLFLLVLSFSKRWKQLDLTLPFPMYQRLESYMSRDALPMLQSFRAVAHLQGITAESGSAYPTPFTFMEAPNLQQLYLSSVPLSNKSSMLPSTVWDRLTDLCLVSSISDVDFYHLIQHCHKLITCEVQIEKPWDRWGQEQEPLPLRPQTDIVSPIMMFKLHDSGAPMDIFESMYFPSLEYIHYRCPPRYQEFISDQPPSLISPRSLLVIIEHATSIPRTLSIDPRSFKAEDSLMCFRLASEITHLSLGITPSFYYQEEDMLPPDSLDFNIFAVESECEDILLPKLEVLEMYDVQELTDETLLRVLISRVDAAQRGDVSPLRHVKMQISRPRQEDIQEAVLERAKFAGIEMKLELQYASDRSPYKERLSPSFSLSSFNFDSLPKIWPPVWE